ncbi:MAG TPA: TolC family protein, partial [Bacteroidia bacterium]|nr:TolC family protein [Bacteroidia bacterium]
MKRKTLFLFAVFISAACFSQTRELSYFIDNGIANSPLLKDYAGQVQKNSLDSSLLRSQLRPQADAVASVMAAPSYNGWGYDEAITNGYNIGMQAVVRQDLFAGKIYAPQYEALRLQSSSAKNSSAITGHELKRDITNQYLAACATLNDITYQQSVIQLLSGEESALKSFVASGIYRQTDFLAFEIEKQQEEITLSQLQLQYRSDISELNALCGISDTSYYEVALPPLAPSFAFSPAASPFLGQFRIDSLRILNSRNLVDAEYRPHFGWYADAGLLASNPATMYRNFGFSFGFFFSVPLYDGHRRNFNYS